MDPAVLASAMAVGVLPVPPTVKFPMHKTGASTLVGRAFFRRQRAAAP
jgi:hypothetical protein